MIEDFYLLGEGEVLIEPNISFSKSESLFRFCTDSECLAYNNSKSKGVKWGKNNRPVVFFKPGERLFGLPSVDKKKVIVIYTKSKTYFGSRNAVVYNEDGTVYKILDSPKLISKLALDLKAKMYGEFYDIYFSNISWAFNSKGEQVNSIEISYNEEWWESRELNIYTNEFGEVLGSGRF